MALNLHLLRLFATVVHTGSFSKAADLLLLSQPSVSKGVRDFELQLGCQLLDRSPRGVRPTREGLALMRHAEVLFAAERSAEEELRALRSLDRGSLRIGASTTIATYLIPDVLGTFHAKYPGIDLHLVSANTQDIADLLIKHEIEVALVEGPVEDSSLVSEPWQDDVMELIVSPGHPFASLRGPIDPRLLDHEILVVREPGSGSREVVALALQSHGIEPAQTLEIGSTEAIKNTVAAGLGVSFVSTATIKDQLRLNRLKTVKTKGLKIERTLRKLKARDQVPIPAAIAFERLLEAAAHATELA